MAGSVNKVILVGNLGRDPDVRALQSGDKVCNLSVATSESWKDKASGERKERTEWHRVVIFNQNIAGIAERYLKKGSKVYVEGQLETRKYTDKDGAEKYTTEVVLRAFRGELTLLDGRSGDDSGAETSGSYGDSFGAPSPSASGGRPALASATAKAASTLDDDIPF